MSLAITIPPVPSGIAYARGRQHWNGDTVLGTTYHAGCEGDMFAAGWFDYVPPVYPVSYARLATWSTLTSNNIWGNTNRFTDRAGSSPATSGDRVIQDHFTGYEWYIPGTLTTYTWNLALDAAAALNDGTFSDYELPTENILLTLADYSQTEALNYSPFLVPITVWSSTTNFGNNTQARRYVTTNFGNSAKTASTIAAIFVRKF
jgi:hypothetical protein